MRINQSFLLVVLSIALPSFSCKHYHHDKQIDPGHYFKESYTGYDINGSAKTCYKSTDQGSCTKNQGPQEEFATDCKTKGHTLYQCDCHYYLCSANLAINDTQRDSSLAAGNGGTSFTGYDSQGKKRTCQAMAPQTMCTQSFGPEDQFAIDCAKQGFTYFQCGCHDYICSENITL